MKSFSAVLLLLAFIGVAAAFFKPAAPFQKESVPQGMGLDNESVPRDDKITPVSEKWYLDTLMTPTFSDLLIVLLMSFCRPASAAFAWDEPDKPIALFPGSRVRVGP